MSNKNLPAAMIAMATATIFLLSSCAPYQARRVQTGQRERGNASWYGPGFAGKKTASGERFNPSAMTAAHKTLPLGTEVEVTNLETHQTVVVKINDRGPFIRGRIIDLSKAAAKKVGILATGTGRVEVAVLGPREKKTADEAGPALDEASDISSGASAADDMDDAIAASESSANKGTLLASKKSYKRKSKKAEAPVRRNGVEYLIEQDDAHGGAAAEEEIAKAEKKSRPASSKSVSSQKNSFKRIEESEAVDEVADADQETDAKAVLGENSEDVGDDAAEIEDKIDADADEAAEDIKAVESKRYTKADEAIEEALKKLEQRRTAKDETDTIDVVKRAAPQKNSKAAGKVATKSSAKPAVKPAAKAATAGKNTTASKKAAVKTAPKPSAAKTAAKTQPKAIAKASTKPATKPAAKPAQKAPAPKAAQPATPVEEF